MPLVSTGCLFRQPSKSTELSVSVGAVVSPSHTRPMLRVSEHRSSTTALIRARQIYLRSALLFSDCTGDTTRASTPLFHQLIPTSVLWTPPIAIASIQGPVMDSCASKQG